MTVLVLRPYLPPELGHDGYPRAWHDFGDGHGGIKHLVRAAAGDRCVRCGHPYRTGVSPPEWSPCDERCLHAGPLRVVLPTGEAQLFTELDCARRFAAVRPPSGGGPGARVEAQWRVLTVHHLDGEKANCRWWNLVALCQRCHLTIQGKVVLDRRWPYEHSAWFRPYVAGYYAHAYLGEDLERPAAEARLAELLDLEIQQLALEVAHAA